MSKQYDWRIVYIQTNNPWTKTQRKSLFGLFNMCSQLWTLVTNKGTRLLCSALNWALHQLAGRVQFNRLEEEDETDRSFHIAQCTWLVVCRWDCCRENKWQWRKCVHMKESSSCSFPKSTILYILYCVLFRWYTMYGEGKFTKWLKGRFTYSMLF